MEDIIQEHSADIVTFLFWFIGILGAAFIALLVWAVLHVMGEVKSEITKVKVDWGSENQKNWTQLTNSLNKLYGELKEVNNNARLIEKELHGRVDRAFNEISDVKSDVSKIQGICQSRGAK